LKLLQIHKTLRTSDWWNNIIPPIIAFFFLGKLHAVSYSVSIQQLAFLFLLMIGLAIFGFALGEWTDIADDAKVGKQNHFSDKSFAFKSAVLLGAVFLIGLSVFFLYLNDFFKLIVGIQMLCFVVYSVPPLRLKRFKFTSLLLDSTYSGTLMYVLAFSIPQNVIYEPILIGIIIWGFCKGIRNYLLHTLNDAQHDKNLQIKSFGNAASPSKILGFIKGVIVPIEIIAILFVFILIEVHADKLVIAYLAILWIVSFHRSKSNVLGQYGFVANMNIFHEVAFLFITIALFTLNNYLAITLLIGCSIIFPKVWQWVFSAFEKLRKLAFSR
jgi:hypothetical protein